MSLLKVITQNLFKNYFINNLLQFRKREPYFEALKPESNINGSPIGKEHLFLCLISLRILLHCERNVEVLIILILKIIRKKT